MTYRLALIVPRIQSDRVWLLAAAAASTRWRSAALRRTSTVVDLARSWSFGRPTGRGFGLGWLGILELLNDGRSDGCYGIDDWRNVQNGDVAVFV